MKKLDHFSFSAKLVKGDIVPNSPRYAHGMLSLHDDCNVVVHIDRKRSTRNKAQNAYYWGVVLPSIAESVGHTPSELHDIFKSRFLRSKKVWRGSEITTLKSTSALSIGEMSEYLQNVILEAAELGIQVPEADKAYQFHGER